MMEHDALKPYQDEFQYFNLKCLFSYYALLIYATLAPFQHWKLPHSPILYELYQSGITKIFLFDIIQNFLLYLPLGFLISFNLQHKRPLTLSLKILGLSLLTSTSLELLQSYNPARCPSLLDILMNSIGGLSGGLGYFLFQKPWRGIYQSISKTMLKTSKAYLGYFVLLLWAGYHLSPLLPTLHPKRLANGSAPLRYTAVHLETLNVELAGLYFMTGFILSALAVYSFRHHAIKLISLWVLGILLGKILIIGRTLSFEALFATMVGIIAYYGMTILKKKVQPLAI